eukprot:TRINITY_DN2359_c0_g1_i1.p1 TRINITY_DN2359_c0_g1~~TRINITY_DN2359_c0_g1_i1.p1  ORF type:complete len:680 (-),score=201.76 TRINITY_DN2359_c0_g1_i1:26-2065(-)
MSQDFSELVSSLLSSVIDDEDIIEYFIDILQDFDGERDEIEDYIAPYIQDPSFDVDGAVEQIYRFFNPEDETKEQLSLLSAPVDMKAVANDMESDAKKKTDWMKVEGIKSYSTDKLESSVINFNTKKKKVKVIDRGKPQNVETFIKNRGKPSSDNINIENLDLFVGGEQLLVDGHLFLVNGRKYGLIGRNGIGKTSLLRYISSGNADIPDISILHVEQEVVGDDTTALDSVLMADTERTKLVAEEKRLLAIENPTPENDLALTRVYEKLADIDADGAEASVRTILFGLGFTTEMQGYATKEFSGGWRMRLALARALFCQPDLLLLDEPTNMLDIQALIWLEHYLRDIWTGTLLIVSHDRDFLNMVVSDIIHFQGKQLHYYTGTYDDFEQQRNERILNQQREYENHMAQKEHIEAYINRFRAKTSHAALVQSRIKKLERMKPIAAVIEDPSLSFSFPETSTLNGPVISVQNVTFGYNDDRNIFENIHFDITSDSRIALVGPNGAGKSTLIKLLSKEIHPTEGYIIVNGGLNFAKFGQHHIDQMDLEMTPIQHLQQAFPGTTPLECRSMLGRYGLSGDIVFQKNGTLSGGQKSRLMFTHLAMKRPHLMFLDEPTNHLDIDTVDILAQALNEYDGGVILVSHDERLLSLVCNELWVVKDKQVNIFYGEFEDYKKHILKEFDM